MALQFSRYAKLSGINRAITALNHFQTLGDESDESTKIIMTAERDVVTGAYQSDLLTSITTKHETSIDDIVKAAERLAHQSEAEQLRFRLLTIGRVSRFPSLSIVQPTPEFLA